MLSINALPDPIKLPPNPLDAFDPNTRPGEPYATYCPSRWNGGKFKMHSSRAHGLSALRSQGHGVLFEFSDGKWVERVRFEHPEHRPTRCGTCRSDTMRFHTRREHVNGTWVTKDRTDLPKHNVIRPFFERRNGKLVDPLNVLYLCPDCRSGLGY